MLHAKSFFGTGIFLYFLFFFFPCVSAQTETIVKETCIYSIKGNDTLRLDRYIMSPVADNRPCVIFMFGGGFSAGNRDRESYIPFYRRLAENGYAVVAIDYRLGMKNIEKKINFNQGKLKIFNQFVDAFDNTVRIAVEDLFDATAFLLNHADVWSIDKNTLIACGSSAGAVSVLQGAYELSNRTQLTKSLPADFNYAGIIAFAGAIFEKGKPEWGDHPAPVQMFHGNADANVPYDHIKFRKLGLYGSKYIAGQLDKMESPYYFYSAENAAHETATNPMRENWDEINTFLTKFVRNREPLQMNTSYKSLKKQKSKKKIKLKDYITSNFDL
jgi:predicted esterase